MGAIPINSKRGRKQKTFERRHGKPVIKADDEYFMLTHVATLCGNDPRAAIRRMLIDFVEQGPFDFYRIPGTTRVTIPREAVLAFLDKYDVKYILE